jgi:hypothetical protein
LSRARRKQARKLTRSTIPPDPMTIKPLIDRRQHSNMKKSGFETPSDLKGSDDFR